MEELINKLKYSGPLGYWIALKAYKTYRYLKYDRIDDVTYLKKKFKAIHGYELNLDDPKTLNEKIQWLKIYNRRTISTQLADKYKVREYIKEKFGDKYLIPLLKVTKNVKELNPKDLPMEPFIIKTNHDSGHYLIVRDKNKVDWKKIQTDFKWWLNINYYWMDREWQYKDIDPVIIVEQLLETKEGKIPNDYKLHCINGKVAFIYVSVDREGVNKRNVYDVKWNPLIFSFVNKHKDLSELRGKEIPPPMSFQKMISFAEEIAILYPYVRVDFYDVDGKLYFGEVTHHHGGGYNFFNPKKWDYIFGEKIILKNE